jgi:hypothetical protein
MKIRNDFDERLDLSMQMMGHPEIHNRHAPDCLEFAQFEYQLSI